jgi:hypothetical protein
MGGLICFAETARQWRRNPPCGSEPARDEPKVTAFIQVTRVIVNDHREQARSHKILGAPAIHSLQLCHQAVGRLSGSPR